MDLADSALVHILAVMVELRQSIQCLAMDLDQNTVDMDTILDTVVSVQATETTTIGITMRTVAIMEVDSNTKLLHEWNNFETKKKHFYLDLI